MPTFSYTAISKEGKKISGEDSAKDEKELAQNLREKGLIVTFVKAQGQRRGGFDIGSLLRNVFGISLVEKLLFMRNLKVMISAGVPLPRALEVLAQEASNKKFKTIIGQMKEKIIQGNMLSGAMADYPHVFSELFTNMIKVGEESGTLENVLSQLNVQLEKQHELRSKILGALTYPAVIIVAMLGIGVLMLTVVVPKLAKTFQDLGATLPLTTRFVIGLGNFLTHFWYLALGIVLGTLLVGWWTLRTAFGRKLFDSLVLRLPFISGITRKTNSATTLRTLSSLIASGIPIVKALHITSKVLGNTFFRNALEKSAEEVGRGAKLSDTLQAYTSIYPPLVVQMVQVGEETGQTAEVLSKLAEFYEDEVTQVTQNIASIIEPVLMLIIGTVVGFFAISMLQPMYSMLGSIR